MKEIFVYQETDILSPIYTFEGGWLQVDILGTLDGADVITWYQVYHDPQKAYGDFAPVFTCSWRMSLTQTIADGADAGEDYLYKSKVRFEIKNAGAGTQITLYANLLGGNL